MLPEPNIIYEVNVQFEREIEAAYLGWLKTHICEILKIDGFKSAWLFRETSEDTQSSKCKWTVHYTIAGQAQLNAYFQNHAPRMRRDAVDQFGDKVAFSRRVLIDETHRIKS